MAAESKASHEAARRAEAEARAVQAEKSGSLAESEALENARAEARNEAKKREEAEMRADEEALKRQMAETQVGFRCFLPSVLSSAFGSATYRSIIEGTLKISYRILYAGYEGRRMIVNVFVGTFEYQLFDAVEGLNELILCELCA
jgi:hypothetical protein